VTVATGAPASRRLLDAVVGTRHKRRNTSATLTRGSRQESWSNHSSLWIGPGVLPFDLGGETPLGVSDGASPPLRRDMRENNRTAPGAAGFNNGWRHFPSDESRYSILRELDGSRYYA